MIIFYFWKVIDFFKTPLGQIIGALLILLAVYGAGHHNGYASCSTAWKQANVEADLAKREREAEIQTQLDKLEKAKTEELDAKEAEFQERLAKYEKELKRRGKAGNCGLTDDDIRRMRSHAGGTAGN